MARVRIPFAMWAEEIWHEKKIAFVVASLFVGPALLTIIGYLWPSAAGVILMASLALMVALDIRKWYRKLSKRYRKLSKRRASS